jgi:nitrate/nitrite transporter NarK
MVLLVFLIAYIFSQFFRSCLAVIASDLVRDLGLGPAELGNLTAIWFLTFALAQFPIGYLLDRHGPRFTASLLMLVAVAGAVLFSQATSYAMALTGMGMIGIGCAPILMAALYYFGRKNAPEKFAFYTAIMVGIGNLGNLLGAAPLAWAVAAMGWRSAMLSIAGLTAVSALLVLLVVDNPPRLDQSARKGNALTQLWEIINLRVAWPIYALTFVSYAVIAAERGLWIGPFLEKVHGFDGLAARGNAAFWMALGMALGALAGGALVPVLGSMKRVAITGSLGAISGFATLALARDLSPMATVVILALTGFCGMGYGAILSHARLFYPEHLLGRGVTFANFLSIGGAGVALSLSGQFVRGKEAQGLAAVETFAQLHLIFAGTLLVVLLYYLTAPAWPSGRVKKG